MNLQGSLFNFCLEVKNIAMFFLCSLIVKNLKAMLELENILLEVSNSYVVNIIKLMSQIINIYNTNMFPY